MTVQQLTQAQEATFYALARYAFNKPQSPTRDAAFASLYAHSAAWGSGNPLTSGLLGTHFTVDFAGVTYGMSGIGYVASYPEAGGNGSIAAIMKAAFAEMRANHETLSYLAPFSAPFYRRFGYEGAFDQVTHHLRAADFPRVPKPDPAIQVQRRSFKAAIPAMQTIYGRNKAATRGGLLRETWWWENLAEHYPQREVAVAMLGDHPSGYAVYERAGETFRLHELFYDDLTALIALGHFIGAHRSAFAQFVYTTGNPESLHDLFPEPLVLKTSVAAYMMARIVDVEDFLRRYPYQISDLAPVIFELSDDFIPENAGRWQLAIDDGRVTCQRVTKGEPAIRLSEQQLVKAAFGVRSLRDSYSLGLIDGEAYTIAAVSDIFLSQQTQLYDYF
ncbi:MAG: GNAT family N-acetyltransferase [Lactobacillus sp.]|nr:GNAT family N-acetyltransferase [Lactobacillus sp.]MCI2032373.1 GNAT family N-acetyltransferase [Lactobacillus sp.]